MWKNEDFKPYPPEVWDRRTEIEVQEKTVSVTVGEQDVPLFYREALPTGTSKSTAILLLHGMKFKSLTWQELGTMSFGAILGHRVVALDIPGYGNTAKTSLGPGTEGDLIESFCRSVALDRPLIVSPSMSGSYALPYLLKDPATATQRARAYIPVAPICTEKYTADQYKQCQVSTLILFGENDHMLGYSSLANLENLPTSQPYKMAGTGHACYLDNPDEWHTVLYNFLNITEALA